MDKNCIVLGCYKKIAKNKCVKNYFIIRNGVVIPANLYVFKENKNIYDYALRGVPFYTYESVLNFLKGFCGLDDLVPDTYENFKTRNGL